MGDNCVRYLCCVEYKIKPSQLGIRTCTSKELAKMVKRRRFIVVSDNYTRYVIVRFMENELLRRGKVSDASLLDAITGKYGIEVAKIYYNNSAIMIAVEILPLRIVF